MFERRHVFAACTALLLTEIGVFVFFVAGTHGLIIPQSKPTTTDFVSFYAAGRLADAGTPQLVYNRAAHYVAEQQATAPGIGDCVFYYPPVFLLLCAALARLPYLAAFILFEAATLGLFLLVMWRILDDRDWRIVIPVLAFPAVLWNIGVGQNALLTAAIFGAATLLVDRRPWLAGLLFGALCYKPHFALLVPVALVAGGRWRAFAAAAAGAAGLCLLSLMVFGWPAWHAFLTAFAGTPAIYATGKILFNLFITPFGAARLLGANQAVGYAVQAIATMAAAILIGIVWRRDVPLPIRAATLISATLIAVPLALFYDLVLASVGGAWLLRGDDKYRLPDWATAALALLYVLPLNPQGVAKIWHVPLGALIALGFAALVAAMALRGAAAPAGSSEGERRRALPGPGDLACRDMPLSTPSRF
jgi:alpha-1,2-mannosyltransferase